MAKLSNISQSSKKRMSTARMERLDIIRITGLVYAQNVASRKVLEKNGFAREGIQKNAVYKNGQIYDLFLYAKLK